MKALVLQTPPHGQSGEVRHWPEMQRPPTQRWFAPKALRQAASLPQAPHMWVLTSQTWPGRVQSLEARQLPAVQLPFRQSCGPL